MKKKKPRHILTRGGETPMFAVRFPKDFRERMQVIADYLGETESEFVRRAVEDRVKTYEPLIERHKEAPSSMDD